MKILRRERAALAGALAYAAFAVCCPGCKTMHAEQHELAGEVHEATHSESESNSVTTVQTGAETITTTVEEYGPSADEPESPADGGIAAPKAPQVPVRAPALVKRTVTVDQRGPVVAETHAETATAAAATGDTKIKTKDALKTETRWGPPWWVYLLAGLVVAIAAGIAWKLKPPWLGWLWKLMRGAP